MGDRGCERGACADAQGLEQAKKEAVTDGIKRTLRTFGNVLGMCLYDKRFLTDIKKVKLPPVSPALRAHVCASKSTGGG